MPDKKWSREAIDAEESRSSDDYQNPADTWRQIPLAEQEAVLTDAPRVEMPWEDRHEHCAACGQDISPHDVEIIKRGALVAKGRYFHPSCFERHRFMISEQDISAIESAVENLRESERTERTIEAAYRIAFALSEIAKRARQ